MTWDVARYLPVPVPDIVFLSQVAEEFMRRLMLDRLRLEEEENAGQEEAKRESEMEREDLEQKLLEQVELALMEMEMKQDGEICDYARKARHATVFAKHMDKTGEKLALKYKPLVPRRKLKPYGDARV